MSNMVINTNVLALNSHRAMKNVGAMQGKASARLSSGLKINSAADDAAGLAISEKMRSQIRGLDMASKNAQDAQSLIQTAEGGMQQIDDMVQRIRELVVYASNDTNDQKSSSDLQGDRQKIQDEVDQLLNEIDSMSGRVEFNKKTVINGSYSPDGALTATGVEAIKTAAKTLGDNKLLLQDAVSTASSDKAAVGSWLKAIQDKLGKETAAVTTDSTYTDVNDAITVLKNALDGATVNENLAAAAATTTAVSAAATDLKDKLAALAVSSGIVAADYASYGTSLDTAGTTFETNADLIATAKGNVTTAQNTYDTARFDPANKTAGSALHFQVGSNAFQSLELNIGSVTTASLGLASGAGSAGKIIDVMNTTGKNLTNLLDTVDSALTVVTTERSKLGAASNRLDYTIKSLDITSENLSAAESRIRDTDMAKEMMALTKANVLQQAATSMLAQANQAPQNVLQLLR